MMGSLIQMTSSHYFSFSLHTHTPLKTHTHARIFDIRGIGGCHAGGS